LYFFPQNECDLCGSLSWSSCTNHCDTNADELVKELLIQIKLQEEGLKKKEEKQKNFNPNPNFLSEIEMSRQTRDVLKIEMENLKDKLVKLKEEKQKTKLEQDSEITQKRKEILESLEKKDSKLSKFDFNKEFAHHKKVMNRINKDIDTIKDAIALQENKLQQLENSLNLDYGPEDDFLYLTNEILSIQVEKYKYKLTPFKHVIQYGTSEESVHNLGNWVGWGEGYSMMKYDRGEVCWNGPERSTKIMVGCGIEDVIFDVKEPGMCEYTIKMESPAACRKETLDKLKAQVLFLTRGTKT